MYILKVVSLKKYTQKSYEQQPEFFSKLWEFFKLYFLDKLYISNQSKLEFDEGYNFLIMIFNNDNNHWKVHLKSEAII